MEDVSRTAVSAKERCGFVQCFIDADLKRNTEGSENIKIYVHVYYAGSARIDSKNVAAENIFCGSDGAG
jgi:hypothetical protein